MIASCSPHNNKAVEVISELPAAAAVNQTESVSPPCRTSCGVKRVNWLHVPQMLGSYDGE